VLVEPWLARAARTQPQRLAIETPDRSLTYEQLELAAIGAHEALAERGVGRGDRVAIALPAGPDFAVALHACLRCGAVAVPLDLRLGAGERESVLAGATTVVEEPLTVAEAPRAVAANAWREHDLDAAAVVIHSSGTSGAPRPVTLSYGNWLWSALGSATALGVHHDERWLCALPLAHVGGLSILVRSAIYATTAVVHERFDTDAALAAIMRPPGVTLVSLVPTTLARLLDAGLEHPPALRCALIGGAPVPAALLERARDAGVSVSQTYGLTEACSQVTTEPLAEAGSGGDAGPPLFCTRVQIADDGEILVRGATVAAAAVAADGWLHTGDAGELRDGRLRVTGRKADTIVTGGENVAPAEVEAALAEHDAVAEAAVIGRPDPEWGEAVCAIVVPRDGARIDADELRRHCAARLASFKIPKMFELRDAPLPRTRSGKLLRRGLR
jgi:O-succinylbenzoic acid--CoA ligase